MSQTYYALGINGKDKIYLIRFIEDSPYFKSEQLWNIYISQEIEQELPEYIEVLDKVAEANHYVLVAFYVTDIIKNGSYIIYNKRGKNIIDLAYQKELREGEFIDNCLSRKKHIVPLIMEVLEN